MRRLQTFVLILLVAATAVPVAGVGLLMAMDAIDPSRAREAAATAYVAEARAREAATTAATTGALEREAATSWAAWETGLIQPAVAFFFATLPTAGGVVVVSLAVGIMGGIALWLYRGVLNSQPIIEPTSQGLLPVDRRAITNGELTGVAVHLLQEHQAARGMASIAAAQKPVWPEHYAPHISHAPPATPMAMGPTLPPPAETEPTLPTAPTFAQMLADGWQPSMARFCLGYANTGPIWGSIDDLLSTLVIGRPGTGKTTLLRSLLAQLVAVQADIAILDPHGGMADLADLRGVAKWRAESPGELEEVSRLLVAELDNRLAARRDGERHFHPLLLLCDEWNLMADMAPGAVTAARRYVLEARKVRGYALVSGQGAPASSFGGSTARDGVSSRFILWTTPGQARMAGLETDDTKGVKHLLGQLRKDPRGRAILARSSSDPVIVAIPNTTAEDLAEVVEARIKTPAERVFNAPVASTSTTSTTSKQREVGTSTGDTSHFDGDGIEVPHFDAETRQVLNLLAQHKSQSEIIKEVWGVESKGGTSYQKYADKYRAILAELAELAKRAANGTT